MLPIDKDGRPVRPGMIWMDARAEEECNEIRERVGEEVINYNNGNRIACWFIEPKALWMKKHEPGLLTRLISSYHLQATAPTGSVRNLPSIRGTLVYSIPSITKRVSGTQSWQKKSAFPLINIQRSMTVTRWSALWMTKPLPKRA